MSDLDALRFVGCSYHVLKLLGDVWDGVERGNKAMIFVERMEPVLMCLDALHPERLLAIAETKAIIGVPLPFVEAHQDVWWPFWTYPGEQPHRGFDVFPHRLVEITRPDTHALAPDLLSGKLEFPLRRFNESDPSRCLRILVRQRLPRGGVVYPHDEGLRVVLDALQHCDHEVVDVLDE